MQLAMRMSLFVLVVGGVASCCGRNRSETIDPLDPKMLPQCEQNDLWCDFWIVGQPRVCFAAQQDPAKIGWMSLSLMLLGSTLGAKYNQASWWWRFPHHFSHWSLSPWCHDNHDVLHHLGTDKTSTTRIHPRTQKRIGTSSSLKLKWLMEQISNGRGLSLSC